MATEDVKDGVVVPLSPTELPQQQPPPPPPQRTKRKRWGERPATTTTTTTITTTEGTTHVSNPNVQPQFTSSAVTTASTNPNDPKAKLLAMQESIRARLAAAKAAQQQPPVSQVPPITALSNMNSSMTAAAASGLLKRPLPGMDAAIFSSSQQQQPQERVVKKAKVYDVDLTVTAPTYNNNSSITASNDTLKQTIPATTTTSFTAKEASIATSKKTTKPTNPYLSHQSNQNTNHDNTTDADVDDTTDIDPRLVRTSKVRKRHKEFHFVEPGTYVELAATKRDKEMKAQASGYLSGRKMGHTIIAPSLASIVESSENTLMMMMNDGHIDDLQEDDIATLPPRPEFDDPTTSMPLAMEWWDIELLPSKLKKEVAMAEQKLLLEQTTQKTKIKSTTTAAATSDDTTTDPTKPNTVKDEINDLRQRCYELASYSYSKTTTLVQHIVPIQPTHLVQAQQNQKPMVLHLTKKELKRQRKLRRQEQQREQQDLQAAGILPAPEPRLTLRNFIQVLGDQAYIDPSQIEQKVQEQMLARQRAHVQRNEMAKLTKEQRAAKLARKYEEDTTAAVTTAIFYVKDMSHPYHRTKVDLNAQQLNLSGCVVECTLDPSFACVIVEGGPKAIKRYTRLMTVRMKWTGPDDAIDDDDDEDDNQNALNGVDGRDDVLHVTHKFNPKNVCHAVWQGLSIKRIFHGFIFQVCQTQEQGRKIFKTKGVAHYWDQVLQYAMSFDQNPSLAAATLKLYKDYDDDDEVEENDVTMN